jgi:hypothetical protein
VRIAAFWAKAVSPNNPKVIDGMPFIDSYEFAPECYDNDCSQMNGRFSRFGSFFINC